MHETPELFKDVAALLKRHPNAQLEDLQRALDVLTPQGAGYAITQTAPNTYTWEFEHPQSLQAQLHDVFKTQAVCVNLPSPVTLLDDVHLHLALGDHVEEFMGRVVHVTPEHVAIQMRPHHPQAHQRLLDACEAWVAPAPHTTSAATLNTWTHQPLILDVLLVAGRHTGLHKLNLQGAQGVSTIWFDGEDLLAIQTPNTQSPVDTVLRALELDELELKRARQEAQHLDISLPLSLADRGTVDHNTIRGALQGQHMVLLTQTLDEEHAQRIDHASLPHLEQRREASPLNIYAAILGYLRARTNPHQLHDDSFKHARFQYVGAPSLLERMALEDREQRLMEAITPKLTTFFDLHRFTSLAKQDIHILLHAMERLGLVVRAEHNDEVVLEHHQQQAMESFAQIARCIEHGTYFEALGVHWSSHAKEIHAGYRKQLQRLDAHRSNPNHLTLSHALQNAYRVLCDPEGRAAYRHKILDDYTLHAATEILFTRIEGAQLKFDTRTIKECSMTILELNLNVPAIRTRLKALVASRPSLKI